jgi:type VI secretion system protein ImpJ
VDYINGLLDDIRGDTDKVEARDFIGAGRRMQVALEPRWLQPEWQMFIGVTSNLPDESCERIFTQAGAVDMKIGSSERIEEVFQRGLPGLRFTHSKAPPRALPRREKLVYFQVDRTSQRDEWLSVQNTLSLAIKVNERRLEGNIDGLKEMTLRFSAGMVSLRFTLYIVPQSLK